MCLSPGYPLSPRSSAWLHPLCSWHVRQQLGVAVLDALELEYSWRIESVRLKIRQTFQGPARGGPNSIPSHLCGKAFGRVVVDGPLDHGSFHVSQKCLHVGADDIVAGHQGDRHPIAPCQASGDLPFADHLAVDQDERMAKETVG